MDVWSIIAAHLLELRATCPREYGTSLSCASRMHQAAVKAAADFLPRTPTCIRPIRLKGLSFCLDCPGGFETQAVHYFPRNFCQFRGHCCRVEDIVGGRRTVLLAVPGGRCFYCRVPSDHEGNTLIGLVHAESCPGCQHAPPSVCKRCRTALTYDGFPI